MINLTIAKGLAVRIGAPIVSLAAPRLTTGCSRRRPACPAGAGRQPRANAGQLAIMNERRIAIILLTALVFAGCKAKTPEPTARLYLDMFEIERYAPHADPQASLMTTRFRLLERPEVQTDLGLSQDQMQAIRVAYNTPWKEIPGLSDFIAEQEQKKQGLSENDRKAANLEFSRGISRKTGDFHSRKLSEILTPQQQERLNQLLIQVHGPAPPNRLESLGVDENTV